MSSFKKGNSIIIVMIFIFLIVFILSMLAFYLLYYQSNLIISKVRQDMFYIVQNTSFSINKNNFKYYNYEIDENLMKQKINTLINLNYNGKVTINNIIYDYSKNAVNISYTIHFKPVVFTSIIGNTKDINLSDQIKIKSMEVK